MPVVPKPAATVILVRDAPRSRLEVFLQRRVAGMAFAGGMTVFPGGGVDHADLADGPAWAGPPPSWWAERLSCDDTVARGFVRAAVRETFEECGVLLAGPRPDGADAGAGRPERADDTERSLPERANNTERSLPERADNTERSLPERADSTREAVASRTSSLDDVLAAAGLVLRADLLHPWARWVTPEPLPKRYDTAFFVATAPPGQSADAQTTEAVEAAWWAPADALAEAANGGMSLMAPTRAVLTELAGFADVATLLAAAAERDIEVVRPEIPGAGDAVRIRGRDGVERTVENDMPRRPA